MTTTTETSATFGPALTGDYEIDPVHSRFGFVARHAMVTKVRGHFADFTGTVHVDGADPKGSKVELTITVTSVDTGSEQRDAHLRTNDFFDAEHYPTITFSSTSIEQAGPSTFEVTGDLTIRGVTRQVTLEVELTGAAKDPWGGERIGFEASTVINRKDYGVSFDAPLEAGGVLVSDKVTIEIDIEAVKKG
jgi:polyisoprenoid-binding protein YceI